jgi:hypothetical protein
MILRFTPYTAELRHAFTIATASRMSIRVEDSANFSMDEDSYSSSKSALNRKMKALRKHAQGIRDAETMSDMNHSLEKLRMMEEALRRSKNH